MSEKHKVILLKNLTKKAYSRRQPNRQRLKTSRLTCSFEKKSNAKKPVSATERNSLEIKGLKALIHSNTQINKDSGKNHPALSGTHSKTIISRTRIVKNKIKQG